MSRTLVVTTPEHVEIRLEPAGPGSRFLATLIDSSIILTISGAFARLAIGILPRAVAGALIVTVSFLLIWGWHVYFEARHQGRSPGKRALSLRVVDIRGLPLSLHQALVRNIVRVVDFLPVAYGVAAVATMVDPLHRRLGDMVAGTLVIRESRALAYAGQLKVDRRHNFLRTPRVLRLIRHKVTLEEREFLLTLCLRADKMNAVARYDLMQEVATWYRDKLGLEEEGISGENFVRDLTAALFSPQR